MFYTEGYELSAAATAAAESESCLTDMRHHLDEGRQLAPDWNTRNHLLANTSNTYPVKAMNALRNGSLKTSHK